MLKDKTRLETFNQSLTKFLIDPMGEIVNREAETTDVQTKKVREVKEVKFSYPKNGLYGLL